MQTYHLDAIAQDRQSLAEPYHEFLRTVDMSAGLYHLEPGSHDPQGAHEEEVLFYVIRGEAILQVGDDRVQVYAGSIVHVPKRVPPRFVQVSQALDVLAVIAPAESKPTLEQKYTP